MSSLMPFLVLVFALFLKLGNKDIFVRYGKLVLAETRNFFREIHKLVLKTILGDIAMLSLRGLIFKRFLSSP